MRRENEAVQRLNMSQVINCIACLEYLGSMGNGLQIYLMPQHLVAKPYNMTYHP